jgi:hypothetical protein
LPEGKAKYAKFDGPTGLEVSEDGLLKWTPDKTMAGKQKVGVQVNNMQKHYYWIEVVDATDYHITTLGLPPPTGWVMLPDQVTLIVSQADKAQLVYFDTVAAKETQRVEVDFQPGALAVQGDTLFAAAKGASTVYALDARTGKAKKEYSVGSDAVARIACHPEKGFVYATTITFGVYSIGPKSGIVTKTKAKGFWIAVDPINGDSVFTGVQPQIRDELVIRTEMGNTISIYSDTWGRRAVLMKYAVADNDLKPASVQDNAAVNGWDLHLTPDGKRVMIVGGGGWRPKDNSNTGGYVVAVYSADNLQNMTGQAPHGLNVAFHPVLNLGVTNHYGMDLTLFNGKSLAKRTTIPLSKPQQGGLGERRPLLLTFGAKGTKLILWNGEDVGQHQGLQFIPLDLKAEERAELEKKYGKLPS